MLGAPPLLSHWSLRLSVEGRGTGSSELRTARLPGLQKVTLFVRLMEPLRVTFYLSPAGKLDL